MPKKTIEQMYNEKQQRIEKAIDMKNRSIAYFNSVNAAIELMRSDKVDIDTPDGNIRFCKRLILWRDWFYNEWRDWFLKETTPQPIDHKAEELGQEWQKKHNQECKLDDIRQEAKQKAKDDKEIEAQDKINFQP